MPVPAPARRARVPGAARRRPWREIPTKEEAAARSESPRPTDRPFSPLPLLRIGRQVARARARGKEGGGGGGGGRGGGGRRAATRGAAGTASGSGDRSTLLVQGCEGKKGRFWVGCGGHIAAASTQGSSAAARLSRPLACSAGVRFGFPSLRRSVFFLLIKKTKKGHNKKN